MPSLAAVKRLSWFLAMNQNESSAAFSTSDALLHDAFGETLLILMSQRNMMTEPAHVSVTTAPAAAVLG
jgi:hypothetical protein